MKLSPTLNRPWLGVLGAVAAMLLGAPVAGAAGKPSHRPEPATGPVTGAYVWHPPLDPQALWSNYEDGVISDTYIPLLTYRHAGGRAGSEVIPGLARSLPLITDHGRTYTLRLRRGLRYSDGEPVRASDFTYAVERMFRIGSTPGYFYDDIAGGGKFDRTGRGGISGIVTDDRTGTIVIHLDRPERSFTRKLAMTWVAPVPPSTPMRFLSSRPPAATGPYVITDSTRRGWTYERNPEWRANNRGLMPRIPSGHLAKIKIDVIRDGMKAVREVERGELDWVSEELPGSAYLSLRRRFPSRIRLEPTLSTEYFWLNTAKPPFDDVRVRRAVNYAVDRAVFADISGGQLSPTQQILPPDLPGYRKQSSYPYDPAKARRLIAAAHPSVRDITLWTYGDSRDLGQTEYAIYFASVLEGLGFTVHVKVLGTDRYFNLIGEPRRPDLDAGIGNYYANYPDPDDFFRETLDAHVAAFYNENLAQLFVPSLSRLIDRLESRSAPAPGSRYAALDRTYMHLAPWVPIGNVSIPLFVSDRIDLPKVISNPDSGIDLTSLRLRKPH